jgi:SAM-dependent methyltransferase
MEQEAQDAMPTLTWNQREWDHRYDWDRQGDEWSAPWGGPEAQWQTCIYPRIVRFLPAGTILEIAPGFGRWTQFLLAQCESYLGVDLAERCVATCRKRFEGLSQAQFFVNDGLSVPMVGDGAVDFAFSFDSLVHCEQDVIGAYLAELRRVLAPNGVAFLHHSNLGIYRRSTSLADAVGRALSPLSKRAQNGVQLWNYWRGQSMTADRMVELCGATGLSCIGQEVINWAGRGPLLLDCISVVTQPGSKWDRPLIRQTNRRFSAAARSSAAAARIFFAPTGRAPSGAQRSTAAAASDAPTGADGS